MPKNIQALKEDLYRQAYPQNSAYWQQARIDQRFKAGDQDLWNEIIGSSKYRSKYQFFFNFVRRQVNMVCGFERQHRKSTIVIPQRDDAQQDSDDMTQVMMHLFSRGSFHETKSNAFEGAVTSGQDFLHVYKDTLHDPVSGDINLDHVGFQNILIDPWYRKQDLSDCNFIWRRRWLSEQGARMIMPNAKKDIMKIKPGGSRDGKFPMQAQALGGLTESLYYVDEFYYRDFRKAIMVTNTMTGGTKEWVGEKKEMMQMAQSQPWLIVRDLEIPTVKLNVCINGHEVYDGENQLGIDRYPFIPYLCYHEPDISAFSWRTQGIVRGQRAAQYLFNRRKIIEFDMLESQPNSGWIYKPAHLINPKDVYKTGQGQGIGLKESADATSLQRILPPDIPPTVVELSKSLAADMMQISGINEELLGAAEDDKAGILAQVRQGAGLTTLQTIFDRADFSQKILGEILCESIQKNYTSSKITNILGHKPSPTFFDTDTLRFGIEVEEGIYSTTQRQMALRQGAYFRETLGIQIPDKFFIENATLPKKAELEEMMEQEKQAEMQQQQEMVQLQMQKDQIEDQYKMSQTAEKMSSAELKQNQALEIEANIDKKESEADESSAKTLKILSELNSMINTPREVQNVI